MMTSKLCQGDGGGRVVMILNSKFFSFGCNLTVFHSFIIIAQLRMSESPVGGSLATDCVPAQPRKRQKREGLTAEKMM